MLSKLTIYHSDIGKSFHEETLDSFKTFVARKLFKQKERDANALLENELHEKRRDVETEWEKQSEAYEILKKGV